MVQCYVKLVFVCVFYDSVHDLKVVDCNFLIYYFI